MTMTKSIPPIHRHTTTSERQSCPPGRAYYVCAAGPFKNCCGTDLCSTGSCTDYPHDASWKFSPAIATATEVIIETKTQTAIGSYATVMTMTLSSLTATSAVGGAETERTGASDIGSSPASEMSSSTVMSIPSSTLTISQITTSSPSHSSSPLLSIPLASPVPPAAFPHSTGTIIGITLGTAGSIALLFLLCCVCVRRRRKNVVVEDKELGRALREAAMVQVERNKALRVLESRKTPGREEGGEGA